jgi:hypothetical protein
MQCSSPGCFSEEKFRTAAGEPIRRICHAELPDAVRAACYPVGQWPAGAGLGPPVESKDGYDVYESKPLEYIEPNEKMQAQMDARLRSRRVEPAADILQTEAARALAGLKLQMAGIKHTPRTPLIYAAALTGYLEGLTSVYGQMPACSYDAVRAAATTHAEEIDNRWGPPEPTPAQISSIRHWSKVTGRMVEELKAEGMEGWLDAVVEVSTPIVEELE